MDVERIESWYIEVILWVDRVGDGCRFHAVEEFDESKRSCRRRLAGHNERRRKSSQDHQSAPKNQSNQGNPKNQSNQAPISTFYVYTYMFVRVFFIIHLVSYAWFKIRKLSCSSD